MRRIALSFLAVFCLSVVVASAQTPPIKNPRGVSFTSADHALATGYELDVVRQDGTVLTTIVIPKTDTTFDAATGVVSATINVQPIEFGQYRAILRTVVVQGSTTLRSENSPVSDVWERAPGAPSKGTMK